MLPRFREGLGWSGGLTLILLLLTGSLATQAQNQNTVTGLVTDYASGEPLPGVTIIEKNRPDNGTNTDDRGEFELTITEGATLVFSFLGYVTQEIEAGDRRVINAQMVQDVSALDEVVVVGYGEQKRINVLGEGWPPWQEKSHYRSRT